MRRKVAAQNNTAMIDFLFNTLLIFVVIFMILLQIINPIAENKKADLVGEYIITVEWDPESSSDIDAWIRDPNQNVVSYRNKSSGLMFLDIDDLGKNTDTIRMPNGDYKLLKINREIITLRGTIKGEYTLNIFFYKKNDDKVPLEVKVTLSKVNPRFVDITTTYVMMYAPNDEKTAFNFTLNEAGEVTSFDDNQILFVKRQYLGEN